MNPFLSPTSIPADSAQGALARPSRRRTSVLTIAAIIWGGLLAAGAGALGTYEQIPTSYTVLPVPRPDLAGSKPTVRMFAHPHCPCTRASLGELAKLVAMDRDAANYEVWFFRPASESDEWAHTDLWTSAARIPGVRVVIDPDGAEASSADASASGSVIVLDQQGSAVFAGGITLSRGHAGDNPGLDAVHGWLTQLTSHRSSDQLITATPVFGCTIQDDSCPPSRTENTAD